MADFSYEKKGEQETHYVYGIHVHDGKHVYLLFYTVKYYRGLWSMIYTMLMSLVVLFRCIPATFTCIPVHSGACTCIPVFTPTPMPCPWQCHCQCNGNAMAMAIPMQSAMVELYSDYVLNFTIVGENIRCVIDRCCGTPRGGRAVVAPPTARRVAPLFWPRPRHSDYYVQFVCIPQHRHSHRHSHRHTDTVTVRHSHRTTPCPCPCW